MLTRELNNIAMYCITHHTVINCCTALSFCREFITCKTPESDEGVATIIVQVDSFTGTTRNNFEYVDDPVFNDIIPKNSFTS